ncbi:uncharacterized protein LOC131028234 [Cryptomeria japonica]|uniref:uncharacterized protein LOC131028234 n=1 Tax=Cryptomeria japonica TaxID=3369 RepID=UPI0027D9D215|nr:uncharacterized protein LOC131028234 [Cryptomeria japonica]
MDAEAFVRQIGEEDGAYGSFANHLSDPNTMDAFLERLRSAVNEVFDEVGYVPARKETMKEISYKHISEGSICAICLDNFLVEEQACEMPCNENHIFHTKCIRQWLKRQNTCPVCRTEFPKQRKDSVDI